MFYIFYIIDPTNIIFIFNVMKMFLTFTPPLLMTTIKNLIDSSSIT